MKNVLVLSLSFLCAYPAIFAQEEIDAGDDLIAKTEVAAKSIPSYTVVEDQARLPILNPALDGRQVAKIRLQNGMEAYLISDPGANQSAAALSVGAGSWNDSKEYPGIAHFCEHMLFMGTGAYPQEFEYMQFIADNGGQVNAATWPDHTTYMFSVNHEAFVGALDRFSHFFIDPLLSPNCIDRELHAVDQEHAKNMENDFYRQYMIFKETGNPNHPNIAFSTGNAATLSGIPQEALRKWYHENYSANKMHLVIMSPIPIDQLTTLALNHFSAVKNSDVATPVFPESMTSAQQRGHMIQVKTVQDLRILSMGWEMPKEFANDNEKKVEELLSYVLGNHSDNSLIEELKREKIAESIRVYEDRFSRDNVLFCIDIYLTTQGLEQVDTAVMKTFQALAKLKSSGIPQYCFDEIRKMDQLKYQYQSREVAFHYVMQTANELLYENLSTYPEKTNIPTRFDPKFISRFLQVLSPDKCLFFLLSPQGVVDRKEKWMGAEYGIQDIANKKMTAWKGAFPDPRIGLAPANPFIPSKLTLLESAPAQNPILIAQDDSGIVYYSPDHGYQVPETSVLLGFKTPLLDGSSRSTVLADLYIRSLKEKMASDLFFASAAGIQCDLSQDDLKFQVAINGYSEKLPLFLKDLATHFRLIEPTREEFEIYRQSNLSSYENQTKELPLMQARDLLHSIIYSDAPTPFEKMQALKGVSYDEFINFSKNLLATSYVEGLFYGNLTLEDSQQMYGNLKQAIASSPYPKAKQLTKSVLILPEKKGPYMIQFETERQGNAAFLLIEQGDFTFEKRGIQQVLSKILQEGFFDTLRTKQQTAYIAKSWDKEVERQLLQFFGVQSSTHDPRDLLARFELFLEDLTKNITMRVPEDRFNNMRSMLVTTLKLPPENQPGMAGLLYTLGFKHGDFHWIEKRIETLNALTYNEFIKTSRDFLSRENNRRLAILVEGVLPPENDFHYERISQDDVRGLGTFVTWKE